MNYLIADARLCLRSDWRTFVKEPEAPGNYKDKDKIAEYKSKKLMSLEEEVLSNAASLLCVSNPQFAFSGDGIPTGSTLDEMLWQILPETEDLVFIGNKGILYSMYGEASSDDSMYIRDIRKSMFTKRITFSSLEEIRFTSGDRKYLLVDRLMPRRYDGESYLKYAVRVMGLWGLVSDYNWTYF